MNIGNIKAYNQAFTSEFNNNNNKTNVGKYLGLGLGTGYVAGQVVSKKNFENFAKEEGKDFMAAIGAEASKSPTAKGATIEITELTQKLTKQVARDRLIGSVAIPIVGGLAVGAVIDWFLNKNKQG